MPLGFILGPCVIESRDQVMTIAESVAEYAARTDVRVVFKASFDKANRSTASAYRGPGLDEGLAILSEVGSSTGLRVLTDIHQPEQAAAAADAVDVLQIPAFLSRQTDLLAAAARTGKPVHVKQGQFMPPSDLEHVREKLVLNGASEVWLCARGSAFGHGDLVVDMRGLVTMQDIASRGTACDGVATDVVFDATHSVQQRSPGSGATGGARHMIPALARAAVAVGVDWIFAEVHPDPAQARSDAGSQWPLAEMAALLEPLRRIDEVVRALRDPDDGTKLTA